MTELKLSWEMLDPHIAEAMHSQYGKGYWTRIADKPAYEKCWISTSVVFAEGDVSREQQHKQLKAWEASQQEPIRNVRLQKRTTGEWQ